MTEGPSARARAIFIYRAVGGERVLEVFTRTRRAKINPEGLVGRILRGVDTYGKNILLLFGPYAIRIHLMMYGTIHIYKPDEPLAKPERLVRLSLQFQSRRVVVYNAPIVEIDYKSNIINNLKRTLGEDPLRDDWNPDRATRLILKHRERK